jgi:hypothetical protein
MSMSSEGRIILFVVFIDKVFLGDLDFKALCNEEDIDRQDCLR